MKKKSCQRIREINEIYLIKKFEEREKKREEDDASFKTSIETISAGLILDNGLLVSSSEVESTTTPSITKIGGCVAFRELIQRMRIAERAPGVPEYA